ncbi:hypothetical protein K435DRAFT_778538 [Dendrothele bispora CBS 962.96]|uniref:Uncharacterized protein n=1 Tax=Dendrothele bispora (strain CBS 962.96) TaxID=1314807 RepID=A0A4S8M2Q4_DENBC|nr:hypothetical protein K435DRAFT_778538 [Dendrothele bispora CBS 962.96]
MSYSIYISNSEYRQYVIVPVETSISYHYIYCVSDLSSLAGRKPVLVIVRNSLCFVYNQGAFEVVADPAYGSSLPCKPYFQSTGSLSGSCQSPLHKHYK